MSPFKEITAEDGSYKTRIRAGNPDIAAARPIPGCVFFDGSSLLDYDLAALELWICESAQSREQVLSTALQMALSYVSRYELQHDWREGCNTGRDGAWWFAERLAPAMLARGFEPLEGDDDCFLA